MDHVHRRLEFHLLGAAIEGGRAEHPEIRPTHVAEGTFDGARRPGRPLTSLRLRVSTTGIRQCPVARADLFLPALTEGLIQKSEAHVNRSFPTAKDPSHATLEITDDSSTVTLYVRLRPSLRRPDTLLVSWARPLNRHRGSKRGISVLARMARGDPVALCLNLFLPAGERKRL